MSTADRRTSAGPGRVLLGLLAVVMAAAVGLMHTQPASAADTPLSAPAGLAAQPMPPMAMHGGAEQPRVPVGTALVPASQAPQPPVGCLGHHSVCVAVLGVAHPLPLAGPAQASAALLTTDASSPGAAAIVAFRSIHHVPAPWSRSLLQVWRC